ncbi:MAG TPA: site-2 protease family protein [Paucimonas sp.]|nr:site-2 protease family protein [Paucimonas sp.]
MGNGLRIGRIAGIDIHLDWSLLIVFFLIVLSLGGGLFPAWHPDWSPMHIWTTALTAALLFFVSVLLHELSHALVGRRFGVDVDRISLFVFGGMARLEREPHHWRAELWMAIVGPITSLVIGVACAILAVQIAGLTDVDPGGIERTLAGLGTLPTLLLWLGQVNILLALFNLVPGFPLDGGRVLRAVLWGATGNLRQATRWASGAGQLFAWILIVSGLAMMLGLRVPVFGTGFVGGLWISFIGWFLHSAASLGYRQLLIKESLENVPVARLMQTGFKSVPPDLPVDRLVEDYVLHSDQRGFPVTGSDRLLGMVCLEDVRKIERRAWPYKAVHDIMTPTSSLVSVGPQDDVHQALSLLGKHRINQIPVMEDGKMHGLIRREDIMKWLSLYEDVDARLTLATGKG